MLAAPAAAVAIAAGRWRIDYVGNISGREAIYSVEVGRRGPVAVVSPDLPTVDFFSPVPSPNGRYVAFDSGGQELIAQSDGSAARVLSNSSVMPVWSPDSTRIAWLAFDGGTELHVARADTPGDHVVWRGSGGGSVVWSRDSTHVRVEAPSPTDDSPDGRWTVQTLAEGFAVVLHGGTRRVATVNGELETWSPDSRLLAYAAPNGVAVLDLRTLRTRMLTHDDASHLTWSPDGRLLAYIVDCCRNSNAVGVGDIRTVTRSGRVRVVVPGATAGVVTGLAWARSDSGAAYRPAPATLPGVYTTAPVVQLAADGAGVAYAACGRLFLWTPGNGSVAAGPTLTDCDYFSSFRIYTLALAGEHVAYGVECCNNVRSWTLSLDVFGQAPQMLVSASFGEVCCTSYPVLAGHGSLVAYADRSGFPDYLWTVRAPGGPPLMTFVQNRFVAVALAVDGDRVLVAHDGAVDVVLSENGGTVFHLGVPSGATPEAQLDGPFVAVRDGDAVDVYAVNGGALLDTWPLPDGSRLLDAAHGLLALTSHGEIFVVRMADGLRARVAPGTLGAFMDGGLATANGARVQLIPYSLLPAN